MEQIIEKLENINKEVATILQEVKLNKDATYNIEEIEYLAEDITQTLFLITQNIKGAYRGKND